MQLLGAGAQHEVTVKNHWEVLDFICKIYVSSVFFFVTDLVLF